MDTNPFVGAWQLVSLTDEDADGEVMYPLGQDAEGILIYTADGHMCGAIMDAHRPPFSSTAVLGGTDQERADAAKRYVSYAGRYEVEDGTIRHHVVVSLVPNQVGGVLERRYTFAGNRLTLTAQYVRDGVPRRGVLVWERVTERA